MEAETWTSDGAVADTRRGLLDDPKWLSSLYFYDEKGSKIFDAITETPEYYPTRTEEKILRDHGAQILATAASEGKLMLAELGSGSSRKTRVVLQQVLDMQGTARYLPIDVSQDFLNHVAKQLEHDFPGITVEPVAAEYMEGLRRIGAADHDGPKLVMFLGSSIGNFEPDEQLGLLSAAAAAGKSGDYFLLGTDLVKDKQTLEAAYNDKAGHTAAFNLNIIDHLNARLNGENDSSNFEHVAIWNEDRSRIEMHLRAKHATRLVFPRADLDVELMAGELIHTESSYKFTDERILELVTGAGFELIQTIKDDNNWFGVHLLRVP